MVSKSILSTYSPEDVSFIIAGVINLRGFTGGTFITISKDQPVFKTVESTDGIPSRVKNISKAYTITVDLMSTSESNEVMTRLSLIDYSTHVVKFPLLIKDEMGSTLFFSTSAWIEGHPDVSFSMGVEGRRWVLKATDASNFIGGNESPSALSEDIFNTVVGLAPSLRTIF